MKRRIMLLMVLTAAVLSGCSGRAGAAGEAKETTAAGSTQAESTQAGDAQAEGTQAGSGDEKAGSSEDDGAESQAAEGSVHHVKINVKDYGTISVELDPTYAPITVDNFISLAKDGFYDGLTFHRIIDGFMIQGGDPLGTGLGGAETAIKGEFSNNGVENPLSHKRGVISMARSQNKDSASSQFFIVQQDSPHLDGDYAAFGHVTEGMEIVDKICEETAVTDGNGTVAKENQPVIESIEVVD